MPPGQGSRTHTEEPPFTWLAAAPDLAVDVIPHGNELNTETTKGGMERGKPSLPT